MIHKGFVDRYWVCGTWEGREPRNLSGGYKLFRRPYVVRGCFGEDVCPVGGFSSFDCIEIS